MMKFWKKIESFYRILKYIYQHQKELIILVENRAYEERVIKQLARDMKNMNKSNVLRNRETLGETDRKMFQKFLDNRPTFKTDEQEREEILSTI